MRERLTADYPASPLYRSELARSHHNLGLLLNALGRRAEADAAYRTALAIREKLVADYPAVPDYRSDLAGCQHNLGLLLNALGRPVEAEAAYRAALALHEKLVAEHPDVPDYRKHLEVTSVALATLLVNAGKVTDAVAIAGRIADRPSLSADRLYDCAFVFAQASAAANNPDAKAHAACATDLLRRAVAAGYRDIPKMLKDTDRTALRRDDFAAFLWDLADGLPPAPR